MAIGGFRKLHSQIAQGRTSRRAAVRRVLLEALESRQMMAVGPQLIGVQPNSESLLESGEVLQVSPRELVFRFDDAVGLDPNTLSGIRIIRSGADGLFERAAVATDFGTNGQTLVEFYAREVGEAGNGITLDFSRVSRTDNRLPRVAVSGRTINIELNSNPQLQTRVQDLLQAFSPDGNSAASPLVYALRLRGSDTIAIAQTTDINRNLVLAGAGSAKASTDFGLGSGVAVQFVARDPGNAGVDTRITVTSRNRGGAGSPIVTVSGKTINVEVNSNTLFATTLQEFVDAINSSNSASSALVEAKLVSGTGVRRIGNVPITYSPIVLGGVSEVEIVPGYIGFGDTNREVVLRFAERLPQSQYRIDILGQGTRALKNANGQVFNEGVSRSVLFGLNLAARVESVVPQPVSRGTNGTLEQRRNQIDLYFNEDALIDVNSIATVNGQTLTSLQQARNPLFLQNSDTIVLKSGGTLSPSVLDSNFYQLIHTSETLDTRDDLIFKPSAVRYFPDVGRVSLIYVRNLDELLHPTTNALLPAADLRLRVGTNEAAPLPPVQVDALASDPGDRFDTARALNNQWTPGSSGSQSVLINSLIRNTSPFLLDFPGGSDEPGNRINRYQDNLRLSADSVDGSSVIYYNFQANLGRLIASSSQAVNAITEQQKLRVREVFSLYEQYLGVRFVETANSGFTVAVGDMRAIVPFEDVIDSGVSGLISINGPGGAYYKAGNLANGQLGTVLDVQDFSSATANEFAGSFQRAAMQAIGRLLGLGLADEVEGFTVMSFSGALVPGVGTEIVLPGDVDIVHGQYLYRPDSKDIDLYQFSLPVAGRISIETFAERMTEASLLDTTMRLYQQNSQGGWDEIAANDDYYSSDSFVQLDLAQGNYIVGVSASGNNKYDPVIGDTGLGGRSDGRYQLRMDFRPPAQAVLRDSSGKSFDGNSNGESGGVFDFWFRPAGPTNTKFVDKMASGTGNGTLQAPYKNINSALLAAVTGDVVRIVGNAGADGSLATLTDNLAYEIGFNTLGQPLPDGTSLDVPKGVSVMIDAGAVLKLKRSRLGVGSTSPSVDLSGGSLLVLGTPKLIDANGAVVRDAAGKPIAGSVYFTSAGDQSVGKNANVSVVGTTPAAGDWGGIDFRGRVDQADLARINNESQGQFLNWVAHADIRYGGGQVVIGGVSQVVTPIQIIDARPTIGNSLITRSSDAAMSATPNSFRESNFHSPVEQLGSNVPFSVDYDHVGPAIFYNRMEDNSVNGLQVKTRTLPVSQLESLTVPGRFDDTDIVYYLPENLVIAGTPGGATLNNETVSTTLVNLSSLALGTLPAGIYNYRFTRVVNGVEYVPSEPTRAIVLGGTGSIVLSNLPVGVNRIYRSTNSGSGPYVLAAQLNGNTASYTDTGTDLGSPLVPVSDQYNARLDARLVIDPGVTIKSQGSRIEAAMGSQLIAEGQDGNPVVFTSVKDNSYGAGGTFNTILNTANASQGDWGGIYVGHSSKGSLDHVVVNYAGGSTRVDGGFSDFNAVEVHQGDLRLTNSRLKNNATGAGTSNDPLRAGHNWNSPATIFVRGAQPVLAGNIIQDSLGPAISIDVNSLNYQSVEDGGRSRDRIDQVVSVGNHGPLVVNNRLANNNINGLLIRDGILTTEGVWDDADIVHVVQDEIIVSDHNHYSGLRITSRSTESLVVKSLGSSAGITARGLPLDNSDRIGGSVQVVGLPGYPVVLTSLEDCSIGAGWTPEGLHQVDTNNSGACRENSNDAQFADVVVVMDESGSMFATQQFSIELIAQLDAALQASGIGTVPGSENRFGLVGYGNQEESARAFPLGANGVLFGTSVQYATAAQALEVTGVLEDGYEGINFVLDNYAFRPQAEKFIILGTDEDRDNLNPALTFDSTLARLQAEEIALQGILGIRVVDQSLNLGLAIDADSTVYLADGNGGFTTATPGSILAASEETVADYANMVFATGGIAGDLSQIAEGGTTTDSFSKALVSSIVTQAGGNPALPGDWRSLLLDATSNDRNVGVVGENESNDTLSTGNNNTTFSAQFLGGLAPSEKNGDENQRLGFHVRGNISRPSDVDIYSFTATAGTEVWLDIDGTGNSLDTIVELVNADGGILAMSSNSLAEEADPSLLFQSPGMPTNSVNPLRKGPLEFSFRSAQGKSKDLFSTNPRDAGMRVILPGQPGANDLYHVRVRSSSLKTGDPANNLLLPGSIMQGKTSGEYVLQVRLGEVDEIPGSGFSYADIRFATNGLELRGVPMNSPLVGENVSVENNSTGQSNSAFANAQPLGNLLQTNRQVMSVGGVMESSNDVDWFSFDILYDRISPNDVRKYFSTVFDADYADGIGRPDISLYIFDAAGNLILAGLGSALVDDQANPQSESSSSNLSQGSSGVKDPFVGPVELPAGRYFLAVTNDNMAPAILAAYTDPASLFNNIRMEPGITITEDRLSTSPTSPLVTLNNSVSLQANAIPFELQDVALYVSRGGLGGLKMINPFTGQEITTVGNLSTNDTDASDLVMRSDGRLFMVEGIFGPNGTAVQNKAGRLVEIDPNTSGQAVVGEDGIADFNPDTAPPDPQQLTSNNIGAMTYQRIGFDLTENVPVYRLYYAVDGAQILPGSSAISTLYRANPDNGSAAPVDGEPWGVRGAIYFQVPGDVGQTTGMATLDFQSTGDFSLYGVSDQGWFYQIDAFTGRALNPVFVGAGFSFSGLTVGPQNAQGGRFARTFFAMTDNGRLVALDTQGQLQPVFQNGATQVTILVGGIGGAQTFTFGTGLAFSPLDFNLWHPTSRRSGDAGHGILATPNGSRGASTGGLSLHFGLESWAERGQAQYQQFNAATVDGLGAQHGLRGIFHRDLSTNGNIGDNYNLPGGAAGVLETHSFSLESISPDDQPTLYFNYFSVTDGSEDRVRVYGAGADGQWVLLASNLSSAAGFTPNATGNADTQQLFNNSEAWRQARVPLELLAGQTGVKLRFEFSTGGTFGYGAAGGKGPEIRTIPGNQLIDGQKLTVGGQVFEIEMGMSLIMPSGSAIQNGNSVTVNGVQYVFNDGSQPPAPPAISVPFSAAQTALQIAQSLAQAIQGNSVGVIPQLFQNRVQLVAATTVSVGSGVIQLDGTLGSTNTPVLVGVGMTAAEVALSFQSSLANRFAGGVTSAYPIRGGDIVTLTGQPAALGFDPGPFGGAIGFIGDNFTSFNSVSRASNNDFEGFYLDDFIVGIAGRGEVVLGNGSGNTDFIVDPQQFVSSPPRIDPSVLQGPYQIEIRGGAELGVPLPIVSSLGIQLDANRRLSPIDRLSQGFSVQFKSSQDLIAGDTFTVSDGITVLTFELDDVNDQRTVQSGRIALPFSTAVFDPNSGSHQPETAEVIAGRFRDLINSALIRSLLKGVSANLLNNDNSGATSDTVVIIGGSEVLVPDSIGVRIDHRHRGGANRERHQGQVVVNASRISNSLAFGASITAAARDPVTGAPILGAARNTVTLNDRRLTPGAVIINSEFLFNQAGGISVAGDAGGIGLPPAAVPYVRLVNNTIIGGSISTAGNLVPAIHAGFVFDTGNLAFADRVVNQIQGTPAPIAGLAIGATALGVPSYTGSGEPKANEGVVSLGRGGQLRLQFTNNYLTGSDSSAPDLVVFEVGDSEDVQVEVSGDGVTWVNVGRASAISPTIDIDAFGFNSSSRLAFVRLTDVINQGSHSGNSVGADIDAVGALSSVPLDRYSAGGVGISVTSNSVATLLNNVLVNNAVGINVDNTSSSTVIGATVYQLNTANVAGTSGIGQIPLIVNNNVSVFENPGKGNLVPSKRSPIIDAAIDSLPDRADLVAVKQPLGISASPILAPRFDINGQLRVADHSNPGSTGSGETAFKDRGAQDRSDAIGPSVVLVQPVDNDLAGLDSNPESSIVELVGVTLKSFDLRLIDGLESSNLSPGAGIDHATVRSAAVLVYRNNVPLAEGVDYRFGYDSTNGIIRLQPIAGIWRPQSAYTIRFVNDQIAAVNAQSGDSYNDGEQFDILDAAGRQVKFEFDSGFLLTIPSSDGTEASLTDGTTFFIDDGSSRVTFEMDKDGSNTEENVPVLLPENATLAEATDALLAAIERTTLQVSVRRILDGKLQVNGSSSVQLNVQNSGLNITGQSGVQGDFGLRIPTAAGVPDGIEDGQTFVIERNGVPETFELDTDGNVQEGNRVVAFPDGATAAQIGAALVSAINSAGLGLTPSYIGNGIVRLGGDASFRLNLSGTSLSQVGKPGQPAAVAIPVQADATASQMVVIIRQTIESAGLTGISLTAFGNRLVIEGASGVSGEGAGIIGAIRDLAGNQLKANQVDGSTILTIFQGEGLDYGDAPAPYTSLHADNGPRHKVVSGLSLGATVSADVDARLTNADLDDGVTVGNLFKAFQSSAQFQVTNTTGSQAFVSLWIDFSGDGFFAASEQVSAAQAVSAGTSTTTVSFLVPTGAVPGPAYARARLSTDATAVSSPLGAAPDGEVEDWLVEIRSNPFTNSQWNLDVNASGRVSAIDALQVINWLNDPSKPKDLSTVTPTFAPPYVDVNGDGRVTAFDALLVINYLNSRPASGEGGEGEMSATSNQSASVGIVQSDLAPDTSTQVSQMYDQQAVMPNNWASGLFATQTVARQQSGQAVYDQALDAIEPQEAPAVQWSAAPVGVDRLWAEVGASDAPFALAEELEEDLLENLFI